MASATVVSTFIENGHACLAARVDEGGRNVEYIGRVPLVEPIRYETKEVVRPDEEGVLRAVQVEEPVLWENLTAAQRRAELIAAVKALRDAQRASAPAAPSLTGAITL